MWASPRNRWNRPMAFEPPPMQAMSESNAMGLFHPFLDDAHIEIYGVEAAGHGLASGLHAASIAGRRPRVLHGNRPYPLMDEVRQINEAHPISPGPRFPGTRPEPARLNP